MAPFYINGTTGISGVDGSAATPALQGSDTNTGISFGSDVIIGSTGGLERWRTDASGRFGIGTSSPGGKLAISDAGANGVEININESGSENRLLSYNRSTSARTDLLVDSMQVRFATNNGTERMRIGSVGQTDVFSLAQGIVSRSAAAAGTSVSTFVGIHSATSTGTGTNSFIVWSNGNVVNSNNSYGAISDAKLKENIIDANSQWDDLKALQVRKYNFKEGQTHTQIGLIAQEAELVSPGLVSESPDRDAEGNDLGTVTKSVNYSVLYMKAVKALQEAMERIEALEATVAALSTTEVTP